MKRWARETLEAHVNIRGVYIAVVYIISRSRALIMSSQERSATPAAGHSFTCPSDRLSDCPAEILTRILAWLCPTDLCMVAACNRVMRLAAGTASLWRRLYVARWGGAEKEAAEGGGSWKVKYGDADAAEFRLAVDGAPEELRGVFADLQRAKRARCPSQTMTRPEELAERPQCEEQRQLAEWRKVNGFQADVQTRPNLKKKNLGFHRIGPDTFVCEDTGWVHVCDCSCPEGVIDSEGVVTCPVSGRILQQQLMSKHEERAMNRAAADLAFQAADAELYAFSARRAYTEGYYASAREMKQRFGFGCK